MRRVLRRAVVLVVAIALTGTLVPGVAHARVDDDEPSEDVIRELGLEPGAPLLEGESFDAGPTEPVVYELPEPDEDAPLMRSFTIPGLAPPPQFRFPFAAGQRWRASGSHGNSDGPHRSSVDFAPLPGADKRVLAVAAGTVFRISCGSGGWYLGINHGQGWITEYYHLTNQQSQLIGRRVEPGTYLGDAGQTIPCGGSGGNLDHVHLMVLNTNFPRPAGARAYVPINGMRFDNYILRDVPGLYNGNWHDLNGRLVLASRGTICCLTASRPGAAPVPVPAPLPVNIVDTDGDGIDDVSALMPWNSDLNGDGRPDVVGFANSGVHTALNTGSGFAPMTRGVPGFGLQAKWQRAQHLRTVVDVNGDGRPDVVGFANGGVYVALGTGNGLFAPATRWLPGLGLNAGWDIARHPRTLVDVTGDGRLDIVGFGNAGVYVAVNTGNSFAAPRLWSTRFGANASSGGWGVQHPRMVVDVNGDGRPDLLGFANNGPHVALGTGSGFGPVQRWGTGFGRDRSWDWSRHPRLVEDVNGDGLPDIVGFANDGVHVSLNTGSGFRPSTRWVGSYGAGAAGGNWNQSQHSRALVDVNGDGRPDIVGFGNAGVYVSVNSGRGFGRPALWSREITSGGWSKSLVARSVVDVTGDGRADIVLFSNSGVFVAANRGSTFAETARWSSSFGISPAAGGWSIASHPRLVGAQ